MKKGILLLFILWGLAINLTAQVGKVGINTTSPAAMLHVKDSSVLFTGPAILPNSPGSPPASGAGTRLMWYPDKAAFRAGHVFSNSWNKDSIGTYSVAAGINTTAFGNASTAFGQESKATGFASFAAGQNNKSTGFNSFTGGVNCTASGTASVAIGKLNKSTGAGATTFGESNNATGSYSFASGTMSDAIGLRSIAMGYSCEATSTSATAIGSSNIARGEYSLSTGVLTTARAYASFTTGRYNDTTASSPFIWVPTEPLFVIGNGSSNVARSNALTVLKNGNVGIGITSPGFLLNFPNTSGDKISLYGNTGNHFGFGIQTSLLQIHADNSLSDIAFGYGSSAAFTEKMRIKGNGNVGIGITTPGFPLNFSSSLGDKISLWGNTGSHYGFGIQSNALQIHTDVSGSDILFGYGSSTSLTETMRIKGNGNVGIATNAPEFKLDVNGRMRIRHGADGSPGIWFNKSDNTAPISFMGLLNDEYIGLYGAQGSAWNFLMSTITGNVGIGLANPTQKLHVSGNGLFNGVLTASTGSSGATANGNAVGVFERNTSAYINILTPSANESGLLFGNQLSSVHGGILYNTSTNQNGMQFRTNGNVNRMVLTNTGALGIGTTDPLNKLHIKNGNSNADLFSTDIATFESNGHTRLNLAAGSGDLAGIRFNHPTDSAGIYFNKGNVPNGMRFEVGDNSVAMVITSLGWVGIGYSNPTAQLQASNARFSSLGIGTDPTSGLKVSGNGVFTGTVSASCGVLTCSDSRYKTNVQPLSNALSNALSLNGVFYNWDKEKFPEKDFTGSRQIGFIAQDLEKVYPEMVHTDEDGYKSVDYSRMAPVLLEAVKEQQVIINSLRETITSQNNQLASQQSQIDFLIGELIDLKSLIDASLNMDNKQLATDKGQQAMINKQ